MKSLLSVFIVLTLAGCDLATGTTQNRAPKSSSGVKKARVKVETNERGLTVEQENIGRRLKMDNAVGSIKHLYLVSAFSGDVILYSTVQGKVTSSGKRLSPYSVAAGASGGGQHRLDPYGVPVAIGGKTYRTSEVLQDDGTYGGSNPYIYWWDTNGVYRQAFMTGGVLPIISEKPLAFPKVILNVDDSWSPDPKPSKAAKEPPAEAPVESE